MRLLISLLNVLSFAALSISGGEEPAPVIELGEPLLRISAEEAHAQRQTQEQQEENERTFEACLRGYYLEAIARNARDKTPISKTLAESIRNLDLYVCFLPLACERGLQIDASQQDTNAILAVAFTRKHPWDNVHQIMYSNGTFARIDDPKVFKDHVIEALRSCGFSLELDSKATPGEQRELRAALADLDDEEIDPRKRAYSKLQSCGLKAAPILSLGAQSKSPEQRLCCTRLLENLKLIQRYQTEIADVRAELDLKTAAPPAAPIALPAPIKISGDIVSIGENGELELSLAAIQRELPAIYDGLTEHK